jgi:membrane protein
MYTKLRLKKYSYVSISTAFMWLALLSIMIPPFTPVAIVTILVIMLLYVTETWEGPLRNDFGAGLTINYAMLLSVSKVFIMRNILNVSVKACISSFIITWTVFYLLSEFAMPKLYKGYSWIIFEYKHFGLRVGKYGYIECSDDLQDWGLVYVINIILFAVSSLFAVSWKPLKEIIAKLYRNEIPFTMQVIVGLNILLLVISIIHAIMSKSKHERLSNINSILLTCSVLSFATMFRDHLVLLIVTAVITAVIFKKSEVSIDKQLVKLLLYSDLPIMLLLLNMNRICHISVLGIMFVVVMTLPLFYSALIMFALITDYVKMLAINEVVGYEEVLDKGYIEKKWSLKAFLLVYATKIVGVSLIEWLLFAFVKDHDAIIDFIVKLSLSGWVLVIIGLYILLKVLSLFFEEEERS